MRVAEPALKTCQACGGFAPRDAARCPACDGDVFVDASRSATPVPIYGAPPLREPETSSTSTSTSLWGRFKRLFGG